MKKIIAYSLWGDNQKYTIGAIKNANLCQNFYPGWICRFYIGKTVPIDIVEKLKTFTNTELVIMDDAACDWTSTFWRFYAADSDDIVLSRDTDSRPSKREVDAVNEWLSSDKDFHIMRDHPWHNIEMLAGMWGCRNGVLRGITEDINTFIKTNYYQVDQNFLRTVVYPKIKHKCIVHDEYFEKKPFPTIRIPRQFVGQPFNADDSECDRNHGDIL